MIERERRDSRANDAEDGERPSNTGQGDFAEVDDETYERRVEVSLCERVSEEVGDDEPFSLDVDDLQRTE